MLVFDDNKQYCNLIKNGFARYPNKRDLRILCRKWLQDGVQHNKLEQKIVNFCQNFNSQFNYAQNQVLIMDILSEFKDTSDYSNPFALNSNIIIFESEINEIKLLKDTNLEKIFFTILCLAKWRKTNYIYLNSGSSIKLKDIFDLAGISCTKKEQQMYLHRLNSVGAIDTQLKPLLKIMVPCLAQEGNIALEFEICDDLINQWLDITYPHCERCSKAFERITNNQKFCKECAKQIKREKDLQRWHEKHPKQ